MSGVELYRRNGLNNVENNFNVDEIYEAAVQSREPDVLSIWQKPKETGHGTDTILALTPLLHLPAKLKELYAACGKPLYVIAVDSEEFPPNTYP